MTTNVTNKRLLKEINTLYTQQYNKNNILDNDYLVYLNEANTNIVHAIIKSPHESVYRHKFIRLDFNIPHDYPHSPPSVTFINKDNVRIHPNMYEDGKCCATILNTWPSDNEKWTSSMGIETILIMFHSFLDNNPYTYEPGGRDDPSYTDYVLYQTWKTCLFDYLDDYEQPEIFIEFMQKYIIKNINAIYTYIYSLSYQYPFDYYETPCFEIDLFLVDYLSIVKLIESHYRKIIFTTSHVHIQPVLQVATNEFRNFDYNCNICFDTLEDITTPNVTLKCSHTFHKSCIDAHSKINGNICSICRQQIVILDDFNQSENIYVINPKTNRKIKVGGKIYNMMIDLGYSFNRDENL
jgi:ubiquitin-protein ligase